MEKFILIEILFLAGFLMAAALGVNALIAMPIWLLAGLHYPTAFMAAIPLTIVAALVAVGIIFHD